MLTELGKAVKENTSMSPGALQAVQIGQSRHQAEGVWAKQSVCLYACILGPQCLHLCKSMSQSSIKVCHQRGCPSYLMTPGTLAVTKPIVSIAPVSAVAVALVSPCTSGAYGRYWVMTYKYKTSTAVYSTQACTSLRGVVVCCVQNLDG